MWLIMINQFDSTNIYIYSYFFFFFRLLVPSTRFYSGFSCRNAQKCLAAVWCFISPKKIKSKIKKIKFYIEWNLLGWGLLKYFVLWCYYHDSKALSPPDSFNSYGGKKSHSYFCNENMIYYSVRMLHISICYIFVYVLFDYHESHNAKYP